MSTVSWSCHIYPVVSDIPSHLPDHRRAERLKTLSVVTSVNSHDLNAHVVAFRARSMASFPFTWSFHD